MRVAHYKSVFFAKVKEFIDELSNLEQGRLKAQIEMMNSGNFGLVHIKPIKLPIKELIFGNCRFLFFIEKRCIYFIHAFTKKTQKTPLKEIRYAEKLYKIIINQ